MTAQSTDKTSNAPTSSYVETESEARARRSVHVVGAVIILLTMVGVFFLVISVVSVFGLRWLERRYGRIER